VLLGRVPPPIGRRPPPLSVWYFAHPAHEKSVAVPPQTLILRLNLCLSEIRK
jgi:hypothetical protein